MVQDAVLGEVAGISFQRICAISDANGFSLERKDVITPITATPPLTPKNRDRVGDVPRSLNTQNLSGIIPDVARTKVSHGRALAIDS